MTAEEEEVLRKQIDEMEFPKTAGEEFAEAVKELKATILKEIPWIEKIPAWLNAKLKRFER